MTEAIQVDPRAAAIRLVRVDEKRDEFCHYEAMTFPKDPNGGCVQWVFRCWALGMTTDERTPYMADLLSDPDTIIQEVQLTQKGFRYLLGKLRPRREYD